MTVCSTCEQADFASADTMHDTMEPVLARHWRQGSEFSEPRGIRDTSSAWTFHGREPGEYEDSPWRVPHGLCFACAPAAVGLQSMHVTPDGDNVYCTVQAVDGPDVVVTWDHV